MLYDLFICHASEDKGLVRPLAVRLIEEHLAVWYDEYELRVGDSLRRTIDKGLRESRYGIVILSKAFFAKNWPQYELDGLVTREIMGGTSILLPVWHGVNDQLVAGYSPSLAGRFAVSTDLGLEPVVAAILRAIRPAGSPLIIARDELMERGITPPIITDEFWLDVIEASNRVPGYGAVIPTASTWGRWSFPLPTLDGTAEARGLRLAWAALQLAWTEDADESGIELTTTPSEVHEFIQKHPGLLEMCRAFPSLAAEYAPQLTIPGFEGPLEEVFATACPVSKATHESGQGTEVSEEWTLRCLRGGGLWNNHTIANNYFGGGMFGPEVRLYEHADYLFWLLSSSSEWLPQEAHATLLSGMSAMSNSWLWHKHGREGGSWDCRGELYEAWYKARERRTKTIVWTEKIEADIVGQAAESVVRLSLTDVPRNLLEQMKKREVIERSLAFDKELSARRKTNSKGTVRKSKQ